MNKFSKWEEHFNSINLCIATKQLIYKLCYNNYNTTKMNSLKLKLNCSTKHNILWIL